MQLLRMRSVPVRLVYRQVRRGEGRELWEGKYLFHISNSVDVSPIPYYSDYRSKARDYVSWHEDKFRNRTEHYYTR